MPSWHGSSPGGPGSVTAGAGSLQQRGIHDDAPAARMVDVAQRHCDLRAEIARQLREAVPHGWRVSTPGVWQPGELTEPLRPDVMVHRLAAASAADDSSSDPPTLCVTITGGPFQYRSARPYAHLEVDHYWNLDSSNNTLEVLVRVDDEYRRAETIPLSNVAEWVDFGIGIVPPLFDLTPLGTKGLSHEQ